MATTQIVPVESREAKTLRVLRELREKPPGMVLGGIMTVGQLIEDIERDGKAGMKYVDLWPDEAPSELSRQFRKAVPWLIVVAIVFAVLVATN